jgi:Cu2+-exporting ATPase
VRTVIERSGYRTGTDAALEKREARIELLRLMIAWLAMMQVMMLAVPSYIAGPGDIAPDIEQLLRIAQLILSVPVVLFSAWPLLHAAASQVRAGQVGMDLPIVLGLSAAFCASLLSVVTAHGAVYFDSITMFVALVLGARWLQARALKRASEHIDAVDRRTVIMAQRFRRYPVSGVIDTIVADELRAGDRVLVPAGETVPADGVVASGDSSVSQAWLTGESTPIEKSAGAPVLAGAVNLDQPLVMTVTRAGASTSLAALRRLIDEAGRERPPVVEVANRVAVYFLWSIILMAVLTLLGWNAVDPAQALPNVIALLVVTCPCALSLAAPAALTAAQSALARRGVLTARTAAMQAAARVDIVAADKTGTLTSSAPSVARVVQLRSGPLEPVVAIAAALESASTHPYARAIAAHASSHGIEPAAAQDARIEGSAGVEATVRGVRYRIGRAEFASAMTRGDDEAIWSSFRELARSHALAGIGMAVLADAAGPLAVFVFTETIKPDARDFAERIRAGGASLILVSGDRREAVARTAQALGVENWYANQTPDSKRKLIGQLQGEGRVVAMIGDGMNDAPVLAQADVSIALAEGSTLAQARADFIVTSQRVADAAVVFTVSRKGMRIVRQNLAWAFFYNVVAIPLAAFGYLTPALAAAGMAASSLIVVANALRARRP